MDVTCRSDKVNAAIIVADLPQHLPIGV